MSTFTTEDIISFLGEEFNTERIGEDTDLFRDLDVRGDEFFEMIADYSEKFGVNVKDYLWYFHSDEQGINVGSLFFKAPYQRVKRIPITPRMLRDFANSGQWKVNYPEHKLPVRRWDLIINRALAILALAALCLLFIL